MCAVSSLAACFTGIESTPRITQRDVKRSGVVDTPEQRVLDSIQPQRPAAWTPGKRFYIADNRASRAAWSVTPASMEDDLTGRVVKLTGFDTIPTLDGQSEVQITLSGTNPDFEMVYRTGLTEKQWAGLESYTVPHLIDMDVVDGVAKRLVGKGLWLLPARRLTPEGNDTTGRRYQHVTITAVTPYVEGTPLMVHYVDETGTRGAVALSLGDKPTSRRNFETVFSLSNPRDKYKNISPEVWELICNSRIRVGMTPEECRLALGSPDIYRRIPTTAGMAEHWSYTNGAYLIFEDGTLSKFRL